MSEIILNTKDKIHTTGFIECGECMEVKNYPKFHSSVEKVNCNGIIHAEWRLDIDAGGEINYIITRCDKCDKKGLIG